MAQRIDQNAFFICCMIASLAYLCADIYLPSIPLLATHFETSVHNIQLCIATLMGSLSLSILFYGPLSEGYGRRPVLLAGLGICLIGILMCIIGYIEASYGIFLLGHVIEGIGLGSTYLYRAIIKDKFTGQELAVKGSILALVTNFSAPAAPMFGGVVEVSLNSLAIFIALALCVVGLIILCYRSFPETIEPNPEKLNLQYCFDLYRLILKHQIFRGYCVCTSLTYFGYFSWVITLPVLAVKYNGWSPNSFGNTMLITSASAMISGQTLNTFLINRYSLTQVMNIGWTITLISSIGLLLHDSFLTPNTTVAFVFMMVFQFGGSFLWSNYFVKAFEPFKEGGGYASSLFATAQILGTTLAATIQGFLPETNLIPLSLMLIISTVATVTYHTYIIKPNNQTLDESLEKAQS